MVDAFSAVNRLYTHEVRVGSCGALAERILHWDSDTTFCITPPSPLPRHAVAAAEIITFYHRW